MRVLHGSSWLDKLQLHAVILRPTDHATEANSSYMPWRRRGVDASIPACLDFQLQSVASDSSYSRQTSLTCRPPPTFFRIFAPCVSLKRLFPKVVLLYNVNMKRGSSLILGSIKGNYIRFNRTYPWLRRHFRP